MAEGFIAGDPNPLLFAETHPAWSAGYGRAGDWLSLGASVVGPGHIRRYRARDDAFALMGAGGYLVAAVADGVGGQLYSRLGAALCANTVCREILERICMPHLRRTGVDDFDPGALKQHLAALGIGRDTPALAPPADISHLPANWRSSGSFHWNWTPYRRQLPTDLYEDDELPAPAPPLRQALEDGFAQSHHALHEMAVKLKLKPIQLTCTLLVVVLDVQSEAAVAGQLGDGAILNLDTLQPVLPPSARTEEDNPGTIAMPDWRQRLVVSEAPIHSPWVLLTDGALDFFPECAESCRRLLEPQRDPSRQSLLLLEWLQGLAKTDCEDDRTIVALIPRKRQL